MRITILRLFFCLHLLAWFLLALPASAQPVPRADFQDSWQRFSGPCRIETDHGVDGVLDRLVVNDYDLAGRLSSAVEMLPAESQLVSYLFTRSTPGGGWLQERHRFQDNILDEIEVTQFDPEGRILDVRRDTGTEQVLCTPTRDGSGREIIRTCVSDTFGVTVIRYEYDTAGLLISMSRDNPAPASHQPDGVDDYRVGYHYDEAGRLVAEERDYGADGTVNETRSVHYDAFGNQVSASATLVHDSAGNLRVQELDGDGDGVPDRRITYTYECW